MAHIIVLLCPLSKGCFEERTTNVAHPLIQFSMVSDIFCYKLVYLIIFIDGDIMGKFVVDFFYWLCRLVSTKPRGGEYI